MKNVKITAVAALLGTLSFGAFAAAPVQTSVPSASWHATDIEAGSNIVPGATTTGKTMDDAFDSHTLVAGEWY